MDEHITAIAEAEPTASQTNISAEDFAIQRAKQLTPQEEAPVQTTEEEEPEATEEAVQPKEEAEEESTEENQDVLSQIDFSELDIESLDESQLNQLAEALKSRAAARIGKLTGKNKDLQEKIDELERSLAEKGTEELGKQEIKDNPFSDLKDLKSVQDKAIELNQAIEFLEDQLFDAADYGPEDIVTKIEGNDTTKAELREMLKQARKSQKTYLPDQYSKVQKAQQSAQLRQYYGQKALSEFDWIKDQESPTTQQFIKIASDERFSALHESHPELGAQLPYILAHAVNSMNGGVQPKTKEIKAKSSQPFDLAPPKSPKSTAAKSEKSSGKATKMLSELSSRFKSTGSVDDFIQLRKTQYGA